jgi:hypothetical protein
LKHAPYSELFREIKLVANLQIYSLSFIKKKARKAAILKLGLVSLKADASLETLLPELPFSVFYIVK